MFNVMQKVLFMIHHSGNYNYVILVISLYFCTKGFFKQVVNKEFVTRKLSKEMTTTLKIVKVLQRDHRTIKRYFRVGQYGRKKRVRLINNL